MFASRYLMLKLNYYHLFDYVLWDEETIEENEPRHNSLKWYLEIIGLDYETVIKRINEIPRLYE